MTNARCTEALAGLAALEKDAGCVAALAQGWGWAEESVGGPMESPRGLTGGIIDYTRVTGRWFVVFSNDAIDPEIHHGFSSREAALAHAMAEILAFLCDCLPEWLDQKATA